MRASVGSKRTSTAALWAVVVVVGGCRSGADPLVEPPPEPACTAEAAGNLFERRIAPLLRQDRPSSCNGCHLVGIELREFVRGSACQSMACLVDKGLVDLAAPADSEILFLINRGREKDDPQTRTTAEAEYAAFEEWIAFSARCQGAACGEYADPCGPEADAMVPDAMVPDAGRPDAAVVDLDAALPDGALPDARPPDGPPPDGPVPDGPPPDMFVDRSPCGEPRLRDLFFTRVWRWEGRCAHCHSGDGVETGVADAPTWMSEHGGREGADETFDRIIEWGLVDTSDPSQSLILLKPLARASGGVRHGGGTKFRNLEDPAYIDFRWWIAYYAQCTNPALDGGLPDVEIDAGPVDAASEAGAADATLDATE